MAVIFPPCPLIEKDEDLIIGQRDYSDVLKDIEEYRVEEEPEIVLDNSGVYDKSFRNILQWLKISRTKKFCVLNHNILMYGGDNVFKFLDMSTGGTCLFNTCSDHAPVYAGIQTFDGHVFEPLFAYCDLSSLNQVQIYNYPKFNLVCKIQESLPGFAVDVRFGYNETVWLLKQFQTFVLYAWIWKTGEAILKLDVGPTDVSIRTDLYNKMAVAVLSLSGFPDQMAVDLWTVCDLQFDHVLKRKKLDFPLGDPRLTNNHPLFCDAFFDKKNILYLIDTNGNVYSAEDQVIIEDTFVWAGEPTKEETQSFYTGLSEYKSKFSIFGESLFDVNRDTKVSTLSSLDDRKERAQERTMDEIAGTSTVFSTRRNHKTGFDYVSYLSRTQQKDATVVETGIWNFTICPKIRATDDDLVILGPDGTIRLVNKHLAMQVKDEVTNKKSVYENIADLLGNISYQPVKFDHPCCDLAALEDLENPVVAWSDMMGIVPVYKQKYNRIEYNGGGIIQIALIFPHTKCLATIGMNKTLCIWSTETGNLESFLPIGHDLKNLYSNPARPLLAITRVNRGTVYIVSVLDHKCPLLITRIRLIMQPLSTVVFTLSSSFFITGSFSKGLLFVFSCFDKSDYELHSRDETNEQIISVCCRLRPGYSMGEELLVLIRESKMRRCGSVVKLYRLPDMVFFAQYKLEWSYSSLQPYMNFPTLLLGIPYLSRSLYFIRITQKGIREYKIKCPPRMPPFKILSDQHHFIFYVTTGFVRAYSEPFIKCEPFLNLKPFSHSEGGVKNVVFDNEGRLMIILGHCGQLMCVDVKGLCNHTSHDNEEFFDARTKQKRGAQVVMHKTQIIPSKCLVDELVLRKEGEKSRHADKILRQLREQLAYLKFLVASIVDERNKLDHVWPIPMISLNYDRIGYERKKKSLADKTQALIESTKEQVDFYLKKRDHILDMTYNTMEKKSDHIWAFSTSFNVSSFPLIADSPDIAEKTEALTLESAASLSAYITTLEYMWDRSASLNNAVPLGLKAAEDDAIDRSNKLEKRIKNGTVTEQDVAENPFHPKDFDKYFSFDIKYYPMNLSYNPFDPDNSMQTLLSFPDLCDRLKMVYTEENIKLKNNAPTMQAIQRGKDSPFMAMHELLMRRIENLGQLIAVEYQPSEGPTKKGKAQFVNLVHQNLLQARETEMLKNPVLVFLRDLVNKMSYKLRAGYKFDLEDIRGRYQFYQAGKIQEIVDYYEELERQKPKEQPDESSKSKSLSVVSSSSSFSFSVEMSDKPVKPEHESGLPECDEWDELIAEAVTENRHGEIPFPVAASTVTNLQSKSFSQFSFDKDKPTYVWEALKNYGDNSFMYIRPNYFLHEELQCFSSFNIPLCILINRAQQFKLVDFYNKRLRYLVPRKEQAMHALQKYNEQFREYVKDLSEACKVEDDDLPRVPADPTWNRLELPHTMFLVTDDMVPVEKSTFAHDASSTENVKGAEVTEEMDERRAFREKALMDMMDGVLEKKWTDDLKFDIEVPVFMLQKQESEYTVLDRELAAKYMEQLEKLTSERNKYKDILLSNIDEVKKKITDEEKTFDMIVRETKDLGSRIRSAINQLDLKNSRYQFRMSVIEKLMEIKKDAEEKLHQAEALYDVQKSFAITFHNQIKERKLKLEFWVRRDITLVEHFISKFHKKSQFSPAVQRINDQVFNQRPPLPCGTNITSLHYKELAYTLLKEGRPWRKFLPSMMIKYIRELRALEAPGNKPDTLAHDQYTLLIRLRRQKIFVEICKRAIELEIESLEQHNQAYLCCMVNGRRQTQLLNRALQLVEYTIEDYFNYTEVQCTFPGVIVEAREFENVSVAGTSIGDPSTTDHLLLLHQDTIDGINGRLLECGNTKHKNLKLYYKLLKSEEQLEWKWKLRFYQMLVLQNELHDIYKTRMIPQLKSKLREKKNLKKPTEPSKLRFMDIAEAYRTQAEKTLTSGKTRIAKGKDLAYKAKQKAEQYEKEILRMNQIVRSMQSSTRAGPSVTAASITQTLTDDHDAERKERLQLVLKKTELDREIQKVKDELEPLELQLKLLRLRTYPAIPAAQH